MARLSISNGFLFFARFLMVYFALVIISWAEKERANLQSKCKGTCSGCGGSLVTVELVQLNGLFVLK